MNCPICDKTGLEAHAPTCPQCNSDLRAFHLLQSVEDQYQALEGDAKRTQQLQKRNYKWFALLGLGLLMGIGYLIWHQRQQKSQYQKQLSFHQQQLDQSRTALKQLSAIPVAMDRPGDALRNEAYPHLYVVRKGDYLSKIAAFFYNDHRAYKKIMTDNQLNSNVLHIGDTLTIKLKPQD